MSEMAQLDVLICGAGIAGPTLALILSRLGSKCNITILERATATRATGQQVDLRRFGLTIMERLGLLDALRDICVDETGVAFVDANNKVKAKFPVEVGKKTQNLSSEFEILRGKWAALLYEKIKDLPNVNYVFGNQVSSIEQKDNKVCVHFEHERPSAWYDLVVAADGQRSRTRQIAWTRDNVAPALPFKPLDCYIGLYSIPMADSDIRTTKTGMARIYHAPGRRSILTRPDNKGKKMCSINLMIVVPPSDTTFSAGISSTDPANESVQQSNRRRLEAAVKDYANIPAQKALFKDLFKDVGWEVDRLLKGMETSEDFYLQDLSQVKLKPDTESPHLAWSRGRVVCLGDAGYCPTAFTGMGTTLAIVGAYVLAGELAKGLASTTATDKVVPTALAKYEEVLKSYVDIGQELGPGIPKLAFPETAWGIWVLRSIMSFVSKTGLAFVFGMLAASMGSETEKFPNYEELGLMS
ncbi:MAG: hypothetical protein Q9195_006598 [Heterodermia aff. obscurata]